MLLLHFRLIFFFLKGDESAYRCTGELKTSIARFANCGPDPEQYAQAYYQFALSQTCRKVCLQALTAGPAPGLHRASVSLHRASSNAGPMFHHPSLAQHLPGPPGSREVRGEDGRRVESREEVWRKEGVG